jgi:hypothetical protein
MHVPKCAGSSVYSALRRSLPPGSLSQKKMDAAMLGPGFSVESLSSRARESVVSTREDVAALANYSVICGHLRMSTLEQLTGAGSIGTVLREPRSRLLSQYLSWRTELHEGSPRFQPRDFALRPLDEFLSERSLAHANDNLVCRMVLEPDPRIPSSDFIAGPERAAIASDATAKLASLGFVGVLELGDMVWQGLSDLFGVALAPDQRNVTGGQGMRPETGPLSGPFTAHTIEVLAARTGLDALVYQHALCLAGCSAEDGARLAEAAFANQLVQLGDSAGHSAMWVAKLEEELRREEPVAGG